MDHSDGQLKVAMGLEDIVNCPRSLIDRRLKPQPEQALKCPRCDSLNTKFCYYNNYSLSQPRYFCKACRRYWTKGGSLRNVPVGGGCRKNKRSNSKKAQDPAQSISDSSSLLPPTYDPVLSINIPNFPQDILAKPAVNPPFLTQFDPLRTGFHGLGITDLSLYSLPTGFHNPCSTFSHGNLKGLECGNTGSQILMHNSVENVQGVIGDDASKTRDGDSRAWGSQWQNGGRESGLEEGKDYWNGGAIGGVWNGMVSNYGPSSVSPFI